jgi:hypothetical protein
MTPKNKSVKGFFEYCYHNGFIEGLAILLIIDFIIILIFFRSG